MLHHESPVPNTRGLVEYLGQIPDPRVKRRRAHKLVDILAIGLCSMLTGGEGVNGMALFGTIKRDWLKTFLELPHGIPSHDTFNRVFSALDSHGFLDCFVRWVQGICPALRGRSRQNRHPKNHGLLKDGREGPRQNRNPPLLAIRRCGLWRARSTST